MSNYSKVFNFENFSSDSEPDPKVGTEWLAQIEMDTHDGPARRLWMGPQFKFSVIQSDNSPFAGIASNFRASAVLDSQEELEGRRIQESAPISIMRHRAQLSDQFSVPGSSVPTIEVGSGNFDRVRQLVEYDHFLGEDKVRQTLADAINDENTHDTRRLCKY